MSNSRRSSKGRVDAPGGFAGIPRIVMKHMDYQGLSGTAVKLLLELSGQFKGANNGDLTTAFSILKNRGFRSKATLSRSIKELLQARMIVLTREGRFINPGGRCALYALTWTAIDECPGKDLSIQPTITPHRKFSLELNKNPGPETGQGSSSERGRQRQRDSKGRYSSSSKRGRLWVVA